MQRWWTTVHGTSKDALQTPGTSGQSSTEWTEMKALFQWCITNLCTYHPHPHPHPHHWHFGQCHCMFLIYLPPQIAWNYSQLSELYYFDAKWTFTMLLTRSCRDTMLKAVDEMVPELFLLVHSAYSSSLRIRDRIIQSADRIQQGDPLGPLLFCLATLCITDHLRSEFYLFNLDVGIWWHHWKTSCDPDCEAYGRLPALVLQRPSPMSKSKDRSLRLEERLTRWVM